MAKRRYHNLNPFHRGFVVVYVLGIRGFVVVYVFRIHGRVVVYVFGIRGRLCARDSWMRGCICVRDSWMRGCVCVQGLVDAWLWTVVVVVSWIVDCVFMAYLGSRVRFI